MSSKKSPKSKSTAKRHTTAPRATSTTAPAKARPAGSLIVGDAAIDAMAGATQAIIDAGATTATLEVTPTSAVTAAAAKETEVSASVASIEASSAVTIASPADAHEMPAEKSADSVMANTTPTAALVQSLRDASADVACEAATSLGHSADQTAVAPLSEVIANADGYFHPVVRAAAAASLGKLGDKKAVPALIAGMRDEMAEASAESIRALASIGDPRAIAPLVEVVRNADGFYLSFVRRAAVLALVKLGGPEATTMLRVVADNFDEDPVIRQVAIDALA